jgi:transcriptional regulator with XRE-family HTH domain
MVSIPPAARYPLAVITIAQIKAARALLGWPQRQLASETGISLGTIKNIESGVQDPRGSHLAAIERAFSRAGVVLLEEGDQRGQGRGVRMVERE